MHSNAGLSAWRRACSMFDAARLMQLLWTCTQESRLCPQARHVAQQDPAAVQHMPQAFKDTLTVWHADGPVGVPSNRLKLNAQIAAALSTPVLMVLDAPEGASADRLAESALIAAQELQRERAEVLGLVLNRVRSICVSILCAQL